MNNKRYQVFISSTYEDLRDERRAVQDVVISMGDFPVQMESFPAADQDQFEFIKAIIDQCDYYILIIAGRYGSVDEEGLSYTHKEFRYAVERKVPVLLMLHGDVGSISAAKTEASDEGRESLKAFVAEAEKGRLRKAWNSLGDLKLAVREALDNAKATQPRIGWVRGNVVASEELLQEINEVRKENDKYRDLTGSSSIEIPLPPVPSAGDFFDLDIFSNQRKSEWNYNALCRASVCFSWLNFYPIFYSGLIFGNSHWNDEDCFHIDYDDSCVKIGSSIANQILKCETGELFKISNSDFDRLHAYYQEVGFVAETNDGRSPFTEMGKNIARRYIIANSAKKFDVVAGKLFLPKLDDEVPF